MIDYLRETGASPAYFGLGFIQLKTTNSVRYHFWHPELIAIVPEEEIHDHRYRFRSDIIAGELYQELYYFSEGGNRYEIYRVSCDPKVPNEGICNVGDMILVGSQTLRAGSSYTIEQGQYHRVKATMCASRLIRSLAEVPFANVARPMGIDAVCPFSKTIPEAELWGMIAHCVEGISRP